MLSQGISVFGLFRLMINDIFCFLAFIHSLISSIQILDKPLCISFVVFVNFHLINGLASLA